MKKRILLAGAFCAVAGLAQAAIITSQLATPTLGAEDFGMLGSASTEQETINGTGVTASDQNDASTYVAADRSTQGQIFTMGSAGTVQGVWVKHIGWDTYLNNGTWSGLNDGTAIDVRVSSVSGNTLTVLGSEVATVAVGSGIPCTGTSGTDRWLYIALATPVALSSAGTYAFDLTSNGGPWFELDSLEAGTYAGGEAYTLGTKNGTDLTGGLHGTGDRTFVVDVIPEPATLGLVAVFGAGVLFVRRRFMI